VETRLRKLSWSYFKHALSTLSDTVQYILAFLIAILYHIACIILFCLLYCFCSLLQTSSCIFQVLVSYARFDSYSLRS